MPKSKRNRLVSLTNTRKKGVELKSKLIEEVKQCVDNYARLFLFSVKNMRNAKLKDVREQWKHSRFFFGKNKVVISAFGRAPQDEYKQNLHLISENLYGQKGLLFTNSSKDEVLKYFNLFSSADYARTDDVATETVVLEAGPIEQFEPSMEPYLRQLGLATTLNKGLVMLTKDHTVCKIGEKLTSEKARILKLLGIQMADFKFTIEMMWSNDGSVEDFRDENVKKSKKKLQSNDKSKKRKHKDSEQNDMSIDDDDADDDDEGEEEEDEED